MTVRTPIRVAHVLGVVVWVAWGLVVGRFLVEERSSDLAMRYLVLIPISVVRLATTYWTGVIGQRKFAHDLWGDTVNFASRLESNGEPGRIFVADSTAIRLSDRDELRPAQVIDLKGKGPTPARFLLGRR